MVKKKKPVVAEKAEKVAAAPKTRVVDYKKQHLDQFFEKNKGKYLWLEFNQVCFLRVKVIESGDSNAYENTLVKVVKVPSWIKGRFGTYLSQKGARKEWPTIKAGSKIWVNSLSLYGTRNILNYVEEKQKEITENFLAVKKQLQFIKDSLDILKDVMEAFKKAPDYPKE